ncbi:MAG TPA: CD225/dispanin family protein [Lysobacter sp.]|nr:CD225/dispanin family protein [Lysobacter sp.]
MNTPDSAQSIPNHLVWAIVSTILATCFCCPVGLIGIVAIVFATQVNSKLAQGDIEGARRASENAKIWCWVATALAILGALMSVYWFATGGMAAFMQQMEMMQQLQQQAQ